MPLAHPLGSLLPSCLTHVPQWYFPACPYKDNKLSLCRVPCFVAGKPEMGPWRNYMLWKSARELGLGKETPGLDSVPKQGPSGTVFTRVRESRV